MSEIHRADSALHRLMLYIVVIIATAGAAGMLIFQRWFANVQLLPPEQAWPALLLLALCVRMMSMFSSPTI